MADEFVESWRTPLFEEALKAPVLVVGAGGIGCELLKNLALTGFSKIHVVDLDTIDISNLNRQFLFRKEHVGKSKAEVATAAIKVMRPNIDISFNHGSIISSEYNVNFYQGFKLVFNALDNKVARAHVNRLCLNAGVPLFESGSAGYKGNAFVIVKGQTECFECLEKPNQVSYPGCTIRNTPSELIHCVVWAKAVFNQLFGEEDLDDEVSPEIRNDENEGSNGVVVKNANGAQAQPTANGLPPENGDTHDAVESDDEKPDIGPSVRAIAAESQYDPKAVFNKLFSTDIDYLLKMENLWKERPAPTPMVWTATKAKDTHGNTNEVWPIKTWVGIFSKAVRNLGEQFKAAQEKNNVLSWDKDDEVGMDFVAAAANIRAHIFHISMKSVFEIKSMAGNIIPAIATTNAIVAGMVVVEAVRYLQGHTKKLRTVYTTPAPIAGRLVSSAPSNGPNPSCFVCGSSDIEIRLSVNLQTMKVATFEEAVLKKHFNVADPDVIDMGTNRIIVSSEGDTDGTQTLAAMGVVGGTTLGCEDFCQDFNIKIFVEHDPSLDATNFVAIKSVVKNDTEPVSTSASTETESEPGRKRPRSGDDLDNGIVENGEKNEDVPVKRSRVA